MLTASAHFHQSLVRFADKPAQFGIRIGKALNLSMQSSQKAVDGRVHENDPFEIGLPEHVLTEWLARWHDRGVA